MAGAKGYLRLEALASVRAGEPEKAVPKYREYLDVNPDDADAWAGLGGAYRRLEDIPNAIASYGIAHDKDPRSTYALLNLISLCAARNSPEDIEHLKDYVPEAKEKCLELVSGSQATHWNWYDLATLQLIEGDVPSALRSFHYAGELTPAVENFRSVLSNLEFLKRHNPYLAGLTDAIATVQSYLPRPDLA